MDEYSEKIAAQHEELQRTFMSGKGASRLVEATGRVKALDELTSDIETGLDLKGVCRSAFGSVAVPQVASAGTLQHSLEAKSCFWQKSIFNLGVPAIETSQSAENLSGTLTPDEYNTKTAIAIPSHPFSNGDTTDWEGLVALGVGVGRMQTAVYPADNVNPAGEYTEVGGVLLGDFEIDVDGASVQRPIRNPIRAFGNTKITVSAGWKIGYGLPWCFLPSLLLPWEGSGEKFVGVTASLVMSLIDPADRSNTRVVEKIILFRWAASKDGIRSEDFPGQTIFLHNHNTSTPDNLVGSLEIRGQKLSVNVGAFMTAWRSVSPGDDSTSLFAGAQFGQSMPNGLPENKWIWPSVLGSKIGPIRVFPICYSAKPVVPVAAKE